MRKLTFNSPIMNSNSEKFTDKPTYSFENKLYDWPWVDWKAK